LTKDGGSLEGKGEESESKTDDLNRGAKFSSSRGDLNRRLLAAARNNSIVDVAHILLAGGGGGRGGGGGSTGVVAECEDEKGYTPLHFAAAHGNLGT
jgi:ankyrin repeat protein